PVKLMNITAARQGNNVAVRWKVGSETDVLRYEIEVAIGDDALQAANFTKVGEVASQGDTPAERTYSFTDTQENKTGTRYYRLKVVNRDGSFRYSPVRAVVFDNPVEWQVYPNPGSGAFSLQFRFNAGEPVTARLYDAKGSLVKEYRTAATGFLQKLNIDVSANNYASGVYLLRIRGGEKEQVFKVYKQ
ncbi:MAG TPA: T9SS type A sorting domain-containing protein, partial [Flavisolibacter sp.]|nr:T9SS type A sorting domain-containing protein [Flavisolibacter sp.]